ncbi:MAG: AAA family ATPase [Pyrinomonadaceae bacterium]|nr:AAA family ATPase [Pyrinomonadaceae bacterium]
MMDFDAFDAFLKRHKLSSRRFADLAGQWSIGKTSVSRLRGANTDSAAVSQSFLRKVEPLLIQTITRFLQDTGHSAAEIRAELVKIFEEIPDMIATRTKLDYDVLDFFGLERDPFALESDPRSAQEVFNTKPLDRLVRRIEDAVNYQGFLGILGEVGAGKTTLKNRIVDAHRRSGKIHFLFPKFAEMRKVSAAAIVYFILEYFGQKPRQRLVSAQAQLERLLAELNERGERVCLGFDECHRLHDVTLTALKNFYELGTGGYDRFLGLVLFGQPQFEMRLITANFREIAERLEIVKMPPVGKVAAEYIDHRLRLAGGSIDNLFEKRAVELIAAAASSPLAIGNMANKALVAAYEKGEPKVLARFIEIDKEPKTFRAARAAR